MKSLDQKLSVLQQHVGDGKICIMIIGLGSVGSHLLEYLLGRNDETIKIVVVGRNAYKMIPKVNIRKLSALIREQCRSTVEIEGGIDFNDVGALARVIDKHKPDFIINSSRAYPGLNYGFISWERIRAYGIWCPLSIKFTKNIMRACENADANPIVINTSYPDAVNAWIKSAGRVYPDFGSGNLNHLIPRIKCAVADILNVVDFWNVECMFAAGHFHDVCVSKDGVTDGIELPLNIRYHGQPQNIDVNEIFSRCRVPMPADSTRNMMNASSNYRAIDAIIATARDHKSRTIFLPGINGELGGYPVSVAVNDSKLNLAIDTSEFTIERMREVNRQSMYLDGIEKVEGGALYYTDELIGKTKAAFGVELPKSVEYDRIDEVAQFLIEKLVKPNLSSIKEPLWM